MILGLYDHTVQVVRLIIHTYSVQCESLTGKLAGLTYPPRRYIKRKIMDLNLFAAYALTGVLLLGFIWIIVMVTLEIIIIVASHLSAIIYLYEQIKELIKRDNA